MQVLMFVCWCVRAHAYELMCEFMCMSVFLNDTHCCSVGVPVQRALRERRVKLTLMTVKTMTVRITQLVLMASTTTLAFVHQSTQVIHAHE